MFITWPPSVNPHFIVELAFRLSIRKKQESFATLVAVLYRDETEWDESSHFPPWLPGVAVHVAAS